MIQLILIKDKLKVQLKNQNKTKNTPHSLNLSVFDGSLKPWSDSHSICFLSHLLPAHWVPTRVPFFPSVLIHSLQGLSCSGPWQLLCSPLWFSSPSSSGRYCQFSFFRYQLKAHFQSCCLYWFFWMNDTSYGKTFLVKQGPDGAASTPLDWTGLDGGGLCSILDVSIIPHWLYLVPCVGWCWPVKFCIQFQCGVFPPHYQPILWQQLDIL